MLHLDGDNQTYVYARYRAADGPQSGPVLVALNFGPKPARIEIDLPKQMRPRFARGGRDLVSKRVIPATGARLRLEIAAHDARAIAAR
jgi:hypothetical protein